MSKRLISVLVALIMVIGSMPAVGATGADISSQFSDMPNNWATEALEFAVANHLLQGADGKIMPDKPLTRAEMATIIVRAFGASEEGDISSYTDVRKSDWFFEYIAKAFKMGVMEGYSGKMNPDSNITREQAFTVLARALKLQPATRISKTFSDIEEISDWARGSIYALVNAGYIQGSNGKLNPKADITRAEFAQVMFNLIKQYISEEGEYTEVAEGNVMINVPGATLKGLTVSGDLIIGDGVGDGDVVLDDVVVTGRLVIRGGGENSIIIRGNSNVSYIVAARVDGTVRILVEDDAEVEVIYVDDGSDDIIVEGNVGQIEIVADNVTVLATGASIGSANITGVNSRIIVDADSEVESISVRAANASIDVEGSVNEISTSGANTNVTGGGKVDKVNVEQGGNGASITTPNTEISVGENVTGVTAGGGEEVEGGQTVKNNKDGTGIVSEPPASGGTYVPPVIPVSAISVDPETMLLEVGETGTITATISPSDATNKKVNWSSSDETVATVDANGIVTAEASGEAIITATSADNAAIKAECKVTVVKDWSELADVSWYGEGTEDIYTINSAEELAGLALLVNSDENPVDFAGKTIKLGSDIDLLGLEWVPIGFINEKTKIEHADEYIRCPNVFRGSFDGNNHTISNLKIDKGDYKAVGLFGVISMPTENTEIKDVKLINATVNGYTGVGVLAGMAKAGTKWVHGIGHAAKISGIEVSNATVTGLKYVGGVIGYSTASITNSTASNVHITASYKTGMAGESGETAGGIAGNLYDLYSIANCTVTDSAIVSQTRAGGIAGSSRHSRDISYCTVNGVTIELIESDDEDAENEGYAGYISGRAEADVIDLSSNNEVENSTAVIYGVETEISDFCSPLKSISVEPQTMMLVVGETSSLTVTFTPDNVSYKKVIWSSSNPDVATVTEDGVVTAVASGEAAITAMSASDISKKATCEVTVREVSENANVIAGDFSVMTISDVIGYNVGFELIDATAFDIKEIVVKLYKGEEVLATNTSAGILEKYPDKTSLSAPFDVFGNFDYEADGCWEYSGWLGENSDIPTKAEITATFKNGAVKTVSNETLSEGTGGTSIFNNNVVNTNTLVGYDTIQAAIDAAEPNHILNVAPGTYNESININKAHLTVKSTAGAEATILDGERNNVTLVNITADEVVFSGFTVQNANKGIRVNSSGNEITNNIVADIKYWSIELNGDKNFLEGNLVKDQGSWGEERQPRGIFLYGAKHATLRNNQLINAGFSSGSNLETHDIDDSNTVNGKPVYYWIGRTEETVPTDAGMVWLINCDKMTVEGLNINSTERAIYVLGGSNHRISNNILGDANATTFPKQKNITHRAIWVSSVNDSEISNNTIISARCGIQVEGGQNNVIRGNAIADTRQAIVFEGGEGNLAIGNALVNPVPDESYVYDPARWTAGFTIWGNAKDTRLEQNHVANFEWGINQHKDPRSGGTLRAFGTVARDNCFIGSIKFPAATNLSPDTVLDARYNYWGYPEGPHHSVTNPDGKGESIGDNVLFYPWYENEDMTEQSFIGKIINSRTLNTYRLIQNAVEQAEPGDTIWVDTGTYTGDLTINVKDLSLESLAGADVTTIKGTIVIKAPNVTIEGFTIESDDSNVLVAVEDGHDCDLQQIFDNNTFPDGSQVIGNEIKVFEPEKNKAYNKNSGAKYDTIQTAINEANAGDTILVGPGTYNESLTIDKSVTLRSAKGAAETTLDGDHSRENYYMVKIKADNVTLDGFTITNPKYNGTADASGIVIGLGGRKSNIRITNCVIHDIGTPNREKVSFGTFGLNVGPVDGLEIANCHIYNIKNGDGSSIAIGIFTWGNSANETTENISIHDNVIEGIGNPGDNVYGISTGFYGKDITVSDNTIKNVKNGIRVQSFMQGPASVTGNTVQNAAVSGIRLDGEQTQTVTGNTISGCTTGVLLTETCGETVAQISGNTFAENAVHVQDDRSIAPTNYLEELLQNNTFPEGSQVDGNKIMVSEEGETEVLFNNTMLKNNQGMEQESEGDAGEETLEELDLTPLENAIQAAIAAKEGVAVSEDGSDVPAGTYWVTQEDMDALDAAIAAAEAAKESAETQQDVAEAVEALEAAVSTFNDAKREAIDAEEIEESGQGEEPAEGEKPEEDVEPLEGEELEELEE